MKHATEIAHFRHLCCLGTHSQTAMPSLLKTLRRLIGSSSNSFYWAVANGEITNAYLEQLMPKDISAYQLLGINEKATRDAIVDESARCACSAYPQIGGCM
jgi:hypothetical protein